MEKAKILVIDDEEAFQDFLKMRLEKEGYEVITAYDGEEGLEKAKAQRPDLVICDIKMPNKDGHEVLREIRQTVDKNLPFVMVSVLDDFEHIKEAHYDKADFYTTKPVEMASLSKNIRILLNLRKAKEGGVDMGKAKILAIDDEKELLELLKAQLELSGYDVITARNGDEGLEKAKRQRPDLIICDIRMPNKDGHEVLKEVRKDLDKGIPFIMLTVMDDYDNIKAAHDEKADLYISKKVDFGELSKKVEILLKVRKREEG